MNSRSFKLLIAWNIVLTVLLLVSLGLNATWAQAASDPPVRVFTASPEHGVGSGSETTSDFQITRNDTWTELLSVRVDLGNTHKHNCAVFASSEVMNNGGNTYENVYEFTPTFDSTDGSAYEAFTRSIDFADWASDTQNQELSSTALFRSVAPGAHVFRWMARKVSSTNSTSVMTVPDSSMVVICIKSS